MKRTLIDKYIDKMPDEIMVYRYTLIELVSRGYKRTDAKKMFRMSRIYDRMRRDPVVFWHYDEQRWADWVIQDDKAKSKKAITA